MPVPPGRARGQSSVRQNLHGNWSPRSARCRAWARTGALRSRRAARDPRARVARCHDLGQRVRTGRPPRHGICRCPLLRGAGCRVQLRQRILRDGPVRGRRAGGCSRTCPRRSRQPNPGNSNSRPGAPPSSPTITVVPRPARCAPVRTDVVRRQVEAHRVRRRCARACAAPSRGPSASTTSPSSSPSPLRAIPPGSSPRARSSRSARRIPCPRRRGRHGRG